MSGNRLIKFSNDAGNDSMKVELDGVKFTMPSVIAFKSIQDNNAPVEFNSEDERSKYMRDFLNLMDVTISSSAINQSRRFLVGRAAVESHLPLTSFDINDYSGKSEVDLTPMLTLSLIAGKRVQEAYKKGEDLSEPLSVTISMTTALPISEGKKPNVLSQYRNKYLDSTHVVSFHNFKNPITVSIKFSRNYVALEGETAQLAIMNAKKFDGLGIAILKDLQENYPSISKKVSLDDILNVPGVLGIDIGGKTTDFTPVINGKANKGMATSLMHGYDGTLFNTINYLQADKYNFENINQLKKYLSTVNPFDPTAGKAKDYIKSVIAEQEEIFSDQIVEEASKIMRQSGSSIKLLYVYGGGSIPMAHTSLRQKLSDKLKNFNGGEFIPIIWISKAYAPFMNLYGLDLIQEALAE